MWPFRRKPPTAAQLGRRGERLAERMLRRAGCKTLARNYRAANGEIDLIVLAPPEHPQGGAGTICFVEVKSRRSDRYTDPDDAVDSAKQARLRRAARAYLASRPGAATHYATRFDIVSVVWPADAKPRLRHLPAAFQ